MTVSGGNEEGAGTEPGLRDGTTQETESPLAHEVEFPPVENGVDYLNSACDNLSLGTPTPRMLKYAVLHLQAAAEVLLKARLRQEHWSLVLKDPGTAKHEKFDAGDFESCTTTAAIARLKDIAGVAIDDKSTKSLAILSKWRNSLQHYGLRAQARAIETRAAQVLDFLVAFAFDELLPALPDQEQTELREDLVDVSRKVRGINAYIDTRLARLGDELKDARDRTLRCPECDQWALVIGDGSEVIDCRFCHALYYGADQAIFHWALVWTQQDTIDFAKCPECDETRLPLTGLRVLAAPDEERFLCGHCGTHFDAIELCYSCGTPYPPGEDDLGLCSDCFGAHYAKF
ncbi:hypothetical protein [Streptomyces sp. NPDC014006]|uniref:hypothetical protein n=1 Tax=Streptomyces sp. NPDC014006 TaxID=3364870 RepID=UPI0036F7F878